MEEDTDELLLECEDNLYRNLDNVGVRCDENPLINWLEIAIDNDQQLCYAVEDYVFHKHPDEDDSDTKNWKEFVPKCYWDEGEVFSKKKSE